MNTRFNRKTPASQAADNSYFTVHDYHGYTEFKLDERWLQRDHITFISIDPGRVNLCFRVERRPIRGDLHTVEVLHHENVGFKEYTRVNKVDGESSKASSSNRSTKVGGKQSHYVSQLYSKITSYIMEMREKINAASDGAFVDIFDEVSMVLIERQLEVNHKSTTVAQHLISTFQCLLHKSPMRPLICDVDSKMKTNMFLAKGKKLNDTQRKDWAVEKALQLSFLRRDWISYNNIINAPRDKCDDLSDTIVQLEAFCTRLALPTTMVPHGWDVIPEYAGWQSGMIFFRHLIALLGIQQYSTTVKGWVTILKGWHNQTIDTRQNYYLNRASGQLVYQPYVTFDFRGSTNVDHGPPPSNLTTTFTFPSTPILNQHLILSIDTSTTYVSPNAPSTSTFKSSNSQLFSFE